MDAPRRNAAKCIAFVLIAVYSVILPSPPPQLIEEAVKVDENYVVPAGLG
jgi:hypothetical protein